MAVSPGPPDRPSPHRVRRRALANGDVELDAAPPASVKVLQERSPPGTAPREAASAREPRLLLPAGRCGANSGASGGGRTGVSKMQLPAVPYPPPCSATLNI